MDDASAGLIAVLNEQIRCAEAMLAALAREHDALVAGDVERLDAVGAEKARIAEELESLEVERRALAEAIGARLEDARFAGGGASWRTLLALVGECEARNRRNGALVQARSEQVRIALKALRGSDTEFYDPSGFKETAARSARTLGTA